MFTEDYQEFKHWKEKDHWERYLNTNRYLDVMTFWHVPSVLHDLRAFEKQGFLTIIKVGENEGEMFVSFKLTDQTVSMLLFDYKL